MASLHNGEQVVFIQGAFQNARKGGIGDAVKGHLLGIGHKQDIGFRDRRGRRKGKEHLLQIPHFQFLCLQGPKAGYQRGPLPGENLVEQVSGLGEMPGRLGGFRGKMPLQGRLRLFQGGHIRAAEIQLYLLDSLLAAVLQDKLLGAHQGGRLLGKRAQHRFQLRAATFIFLDGEPPVPVQVQDGLRPGQTGQTLPGHKRQAQDQAQRRESQHPGAKPMVPYPPLHAPVIPADKHILKRKPGQEGMGPESRLAFVPPPVIDRNHKNGNQIGREQHHRHGQGFITEQGSGHTADKHQRNKNGAGGENGTEHGPRHLPGSGEDRLLQRIAPLPAGSDVIYKDDGIVHHHTHPQEQTGEGDNIQGHAGEVENQHGNDQRGGHGKRHQSRAPEILHEQENHHTGHQYAQEDIPQQAVDGVLQQLRLIPGKGETKGRIIFPEAA